MSDRSLLSWPSTEYVDKIEDSETSIDLPESLLHYHDTGHRSKRFGFMIQIYTALLTATICALLASWLYIWSLNGCIDFGTVNTAGDVVEYQFSRDLRFMSLDHQYDSLWDFGNMSTLKVPEPELDTGEKVDAAISM